MKRILIGGLALLVVAGLVIGLIFRDNIQRVRMVTSLFSGAEQYQNFHRVADFFPSTTLPPSPTPFRFGQGDPIELPERFTQNGREFETEAFLTKTDTSALLVIHDGDIRFERYMLTGGENETWLSMSVAKSFISTLVSIAIEEGHIQSIEEPITQYVPELDGSAYDGVRIKDVLQMSSGASWNEDYSDPNSDINRFGRIFAIGGSLDEFTASLAREFEPGTVNRYNSADTQALGMLVVRATGRTVTDYMIEKLWHPMGTTAEGHWLLDSDGMEMAFAGFNATARDYAKLGELFRRGGALNGQQIVPEDWAKAAVTPDAPHLQPGAGDDGFDLGYGYQWWVPNGDEGEFSAVGVYNQFIYVNPTRQSVIVKLSAYSDYAIDLSEDSYLEMQTIELFRAINAQFDPVETITDNDEME